MSESNPAPSVPPASPANAGRPLLLVFYNNPDGYPPIINGLRLLAGAGFEVEVFCRDDGHDWGVAYPAGVRLHRLRGATGNSMRDFGDFLMRVLRGADKRAGVVMGHDAHGFLVARLLSWVRRRPLIYHCHDYADASDAQNITTRGVKLARDFEQRFARTAQVVIVPDADRAQVMKRELRLMEEPLIVANAPLAASATTERDDALPQALAAQGKQFERVVFRQGRIGDGHAIEATLRSLPEWSNPRWGFAVMGPGDEAYRARLLEIARELGVEDRFAILPPVGYDKVSQFTRGADVGHALYQPLHVNNVHISTASNKIMEYLSVGLPLLVSDTPALRALVENYSCGACADESAPAAIARAVNALLGDAPSAAQMGQSARRAFEEVFCYDRQFAPIIEVVRALGAGRSIKRELSGHT